jgi:hypothetical protein
VLQRLDAALHEAQTFDAARSQRRFVLHMRTSAPTSSCRS